MLPTFNKTVTLFHCIRASKETKNIDEWVVTVLKNCSVSTEVATTRYTDSINSNDSKVYMKIKTLDIRGYKPRREYTKKDFTYTIDTNDFIFLGVVDEEVTPENVVDIVNKYKPNSVRVVSVDENLTKGVVPHLKIIGV